MMIACNSAITTETLKNGFIHLQIQNIRRIMFYKVINDHLIISIHLHTTKPLNIQNHKTPLGFKYSKVVFVL